MYKPHPQLSSMISEKNNSKKQSTVSCYIEQLVQSDVCACFQILVVWCFCDVCSCNSYKEKSLNFCPEKVYEPYVSLFAHAESSVKDMFFGILKQNCTKHISCSSIQLTTEGKSGHPNS